MNSRYDIEIFNEMLHDAFLKQQQETDFANFLLSALKSGDKTLYQKHITERKKFDDTWIGVIESYLPSIDKITRNVKSQLKFEEEIIPIEKTKRVNSQSIRHLSTNTKYLRETSEDEYMPEKVLSNIGEIEYGIYENRFIMTLISRLKDYTYERLNLIKESLYANRKMHFNAENSFEFIDANYHIKIDLVKEEKFRQKKEDEDNERVYQRCEQLYKHISVLMNSPFYKQMEKYKKVVPPILKTQVILKNPDFKAAYFLWLFLDQNFRLDFKYDKESHNKRFTELYKENINQLFMHVVSLTLSNDTQFQKEEHMIHKEKKEIQPKIITKLPTEFTLDETPDSIVENQVMNEYFLLKIKQQLGRNLVEYKGDNKDTKVNFKKALEDVLSIQNSVIEEALKINQDEDVFSQLTQAKTLEKSLENALLKQKVSSIVRDVKYADLRRMLTLERKWNEEIKSLKKKIIKNEANLSNETIKKYTIVESEKLEKAVKRALASENKKLTNAYNREKQKLLSERMKLDKELKEAKKKLKEKEKKELLKAKEKLQKQKEKEKLQKLAKQNKAFEKKMNDLKNKREKMLKEVEENKSH